MSQIKKSVSIKLKTAIKDGSDEETNALTSSGVWIRKGALDVLRFKESIDEEYVTTLITIQPKRVSIKRSGSVSMHQQFRLGEPTENVYKHPYGNLHMETMTNRMMYQPLSRQAPARLIIDYQVSLNGQDSRNHILELLFEEEAPR
jgi:uncharacterized beta-barrel protein YwiB (DUF1934 family)